MPDVPKRGCSLSFRRARVAEMRAGATPKEVAEKYGLKLATIRGWLQAINRSHRRAEQVKAEQAGKWS